MKANHSFAVVPSLLFAYVLVVGITGCVIPVPHTDSSFTRTNVNEQVVRQFTREQITEEDVILKLGEPATTNPPSNPYHYENQPET